MKVEAPPSAFGSGVVDLTEPDWDLFGAPGSEAEDDRAAQAQES